MRTRGILEELGTMPAFIIPLLLGVILLGTILRGVYLFRGKEF